jgi:hypothetical protein
MKHQVRWLTLSFALPSVAEVGGEAEPTKTNEHVKFAYFQLPSSSALNNRMYPIWEINFVTRTPLPS